jgi:8-oxo-dGTP diphosphatase
MALARSKFGSELRDYYVTDIIDIPDHLKHIPLTFSVAVLRHQGQIVMVYDRGRKQWEIPGGGLEPGETPYECVIREIFEESGQRASNLRLCGIFSFYLKSKDNCELGALYIGDVEELLPFAGNDEISEMRLWDMRSTLPDYSGDVTSKWIEWASRALSTE